MEQFLKTYSDLPNGFIEDFMNFDNQTDNKFTIDLEIVDKWLNSRKDNLKRLLTSNFEQNYDYIINLEIQQHKTGAVKREFILLSSDCFKELCMLSQTAKAKEVRKYYLTLEKLMKKYHYMIEDNLRSRIGLLENNQRPKYNISGGVIYILNAVHPVPTKMPRKDKEFLKMGKATNADKRFSSYNTGRAYDVEPLFILEVDDIDRVENCIKNLVSQYQYRKNREIYHISLDLLKKACYDCSVLLRSFKQSAEKIKSNNMFEDQLAKMESADANNTLVMKFKNDKQKQLTANRDSGQWPANS